LASAILLAQQGLEVMVLDRDEPPPGDPETAWDSWDKGSVGQFRLVHYLSPAAGRSSKSTCRTCSTSCKRLAPSGSIPLRQRLAFCLMVPAMTST
jgi:hypothetical protein